MTQETSPIISAEVVLQSRSGQSLLTTTEPVTSANVEVFSPTPEIVAKATQQLRSLGFAVLSTGITLTVQAEASLFESVFHVPIVLHRDAVTGTMQAEPSGEAIIPDDLSSVVEAIVFPQPPDFFVSPW
jgi:subtilase family serine protease